MARGIADLGAEGDLARRVAALPQRPRREGRASWQGAARLADRTVRRTHARRLRRHGHGDQRRRIDPRDTAPRDAPRGDGSHLQRQRLCRGSPQPRKARIGSINFTSAPDQADSIWRAADHIIADLRENGPTAAELATHVEKERRETEVSARTNEWWLANIVDHVETDSPLAAITAWSERLDALTVARVRTAAHIVFDPSNVARFTLLPEETR